MGTRYASASKLALAIAADVSRPGDWHSASQQRQRPQFAAIEAIVYKAGARYSRDDHIVRHWVQQELPQDGFRQRTARHSKLFISEIDEYKGSQWSPTAEYSGLPARVQIERIIS